MISLMLYLVHNKFLLNKTSIYDAWLRLILEEPHELGKNGFELKQQQNEIWYHILLCFHIQIPLIYLPYSQENPRQNINFITTSQLYSWRYHKDEMKITVLFNQNTYLTNNVVRLFLHCTPTGQIKRLFIDTFYIH